MNKYLVFYEQYGGFECHGQRVDMFVAENLIDLCKTCEWLEKAVEHEFDDRPFTEREFIDFIDNIDIGGWDGFAIYLIEEDKLKEIANSGIMELG